MLTNTQSLPYTAGDLIRYKTYSGDVRAVLVKTVYADIKNGRPGFDGLTVPGAEPVWGYTAQVIEVCERTGDA
jgi:hypothetical protein